MEISRAWNRRARMAAVLAMFAGLPAIAQTFNSIDNFDDNDDEGWTHLTAGDVLLSDGRWEFADGHYVLRSETAIGPGNSAQVITTLNNSDEAQFQNGILRVQFRVNEANAGAMLGMRILTDSQGLLSGYTVMFNPSTLDSNAATLNRVDQGAATTIDSLARVDFSIVEDTDYTAELSVVGDDLEVRVWVNGDTRPESPQMSTTDTVHSQGRFMLASFVNNQLATTPASATFDDVEFAVQDPTPRPRVIGDVNDDGFVDLFWHNRASRDVLAWHVDNSPGNGSFILSNRVIATLPDDGTVIVGRGDFNNDGYTDLVYRNKRTGANRVVTNVGRQDEGTTDLPAVTSRDWHIVGVGDFNNDDKSDLLWRNTKEGSTILWTMEGANVTSALTLPAVTDRAWHPSGTGDLDGDGNADIVWRNQKTGQTVIWMMVGSLVMQQTTLEPAVLQQSWQIGDVADFTGDGKADIVWRNLVSGEDVIWEMNGAAVTNSYVIPQVIDLNWYFVGMNDAAPSVKKDDFNSDAKAEIVWRNVANGENLLWTMSSADQVGGVIALPSVTGAQWSVNAVGDINFDNKPDLIWRNSETGDNVAWLMDGATYGGSVALPSASTEWRLFGLADVNNDGINDMYWHNANTGDVAVWILDATPGDDVTVVSSLSLPGEVNTSWMPKGVADIDGNDSPDIVWRGSGRNVVWFMSGSIVSSTIQMPMVNDAAWDIAKVSDMNDDQIPDLVWHNDSTGASTIWLISTDIADLYAGALFLPTVTDTNWQIQENANGSVQP